MSRITVIVALLLLLLPYSGVSAQVPVSLLEGVSSGDTLRVEVTIGEVGKPLPAAVSSFQFAVSVPDSSMAFLGIETAYTASGKDGWTARANPANGRVGGFSSSLDAIEEGGVLTVLVFSLSSECVSGAIGLDIFKLNAGNPVHTPQIPAFNIERCTGD